MTSLAKPPPQPGNEARERAFWETHDSSSYVDWTAAKIVKLSNLKPSKINAHRLPCDSTTTATSSAP